MKDITIGEPVFLTKNGRGRYAIIDMAEYEKAVRNEEDWISSDDVKNSLTTSMAVF